MERRSTTAILRLINREDRRVARAVARVLPAVGRAVQRVVETLRGRGRVLFLGAGSSGRLGAIEAAEWPPTFGVPARTAQAIVAGGARALRRSVEAAEDGDATGQIEKRRLTARDLLIGISAGSTTRFVRTGIRAAKRRGCTTILITCSHSPADRGCIDVLINPLVGPEVIAGSTRMKAGTATKMVLNMVSTAAMVRLGRVYDNLMIGLTPTSRKLRRRAVGIVSRVLGLSMRRGRALLETADWDLGTVIRTRARSAQG